MAKPADVVNSDLATTLCLSSKYLSSETSQQTEDKKKIEEQQAAGALEKVRAGLEQTAAKERKPWDEKERKEEEYRQATLLLLKRKGQKTQFQAEESSIDAELRVLVATLKQKKQQSSELWDKICTVNNKITVDALMLQTNDKIHEKWEKDLQAEELALKGKKEVYEGAIEHRTSVPESAENHKNEYQAQQIRVQKLRQQLCNGLREARNNRVALDAQQRVLQNLRKCYSTLDGEINQLGEKIKIIERKKRELRQAEIKRLAAEREKLEQLERARIEAEQKAREEAERLALPTPPIPPIPPARLPVDHPAGASQAVETRPAEEERQTQKRERNLLCQLELQRTREREESVEHLEKAKRIAAIKQEEQSRKVQHIFS